MCLTLYVRAPVDKPTMESVALQARLQGLTVEVEAIPFVPVPRLRRRHDGWTDDRQRGFIAALAQCGSVSAAARHVGKTARSAYRLLDAPGADSFARAWDVAVECGVDRTRTDALNRALHGQLVPIYRKGKLHRVELRKSDRLALGLLAGRASGAAFGPRLSAEDRASHRADQRQYDAAHTYHARDLVMTEILARIEATFAPRRAGSDRFGVGLRRPEIGGKVGKPRRISATNRRKRASPLVFCDLCGFKRGPPDRRKPLIVACFQSDRACRPRPVSSPSHSAGTPPPRPCLSRGP